MQKILGIIAEYNPLHLGHYHQLRLAAKETGSNYIVIAMSGNFVQRGEPAVLDKWSRAEMALAAGADLVVEIPVWFVLQSAEGFARAGVSTLAACGTTHISFGSESGDLSRLGALARWLSTSCTQNAIKEQLQTGITYAAAVQRAAEFSLEAAPLAPLLRGANNILAIEYLRAVQSFAPKISVHTVKRIGPEHGSSRAGKWAGATALRRLLAKGLERQVMTYIPPCSKGAFEQAMANSGPVFPEDFAQLIFYALLTLGDKDLSKLPACSEGIENRIRKALKSQSTLSDLVDAIKTKRYPRTRIQRLLFQALLQFHTVTCPGNYTPYLRVLACSNRGKNLLPILAETGKAPLLYSARNIKTLDECAKSLLNLDLCATAVYNLVRSNPCQSDICKNPIFKGPQ